MANIILGTWSWGAGMFGGDSVFGSHTDEHILQPVFDAATEAGLRTWDTATAYAMGDSECILGSFIAGKKREDYIISTKFTPQLTGKPFDYAFAPATDYYLKAHLFGDIFARDNLTYADRELVTVSALSGLQGVEPQLRAHIAGARNMGVTEEQLQGIVVALAANGLWYEAGRLAGLLETEWPQGKPNDAYAQYFVGQSFLQPYYGGVANVTFEPRCRNNWHVHHGAVQVLICVSGKGWYQEWGKPAVPLTPGTVIAIPEGVKHWHGAAADSWMKHLAIHTQEQPGATNEWLEPVNDRQYDTVNE